jgi:hypothetical protein
MGAADMNLTGKGHRFPPGHDFYPRTEKYTDDERAVRKIKLAIRASYGWRTWSETGKRWRYPRSMLSADQAAFLDTAARARHRIDKLGDKISVADLSSLTNIERRARRALYGAMT